MANRLNFINTARELVDLLQTTRTEYVKLQDDLQTLDLINKGIKLFEWHDLPQEIPLRMVERNLFFRGKLVFFKHDTLGYFMLPFVYVNKVNAYGIQNHIRPIVVGEYEELSGLELEVGEDCVIVRDNELEVPPVWYANFYGKKISDLYSIRDKNNLWLSLPAILKSSGDIAKDNKNALEMKSILYKNGAELAVITDAVNQLELLNVKPQYFGLEIYEQIKTLKNDYLEYLGLDHNLEKKERLITDEVMANKIENSINITKRLEPRESAIKDINKMFGLNISISVNKSITATENVDTSTRVDSKALIINRRSMGGNQE